MVVAHNSPFVKEHNAASNQILPVLTQLNDGIRGRKLTERKIYEFPADISQQSHSKLRSQISHPRSDCVIPPAIFSMLVHSSHTLQPSGAGSTLTLTMLLQSSWETTMDRAPAYLSPSMSDLSSKLE
jgi:hypothetical protein